MFEIEEGKPASKSSDTSDTAIVTFYAIGKTFYSFDEFIKNVMAFMIILKNFGS